VERFERWPLLGAAVVLAGTGLALDLTAAEVAPFAVACLALAAAAFGAFLYAEGARHREWWHPNDRIADTSQDPPGQHGDS
jgi:hypothetical protein